MSNIQVGGHSYETKLDEHGTERFIANEEHFIVKQMQPAFGGKGKKTPNDIAIEFDKGLISLRDYAETNIFLGYSIGGFTELHRLFEIEVAQEDSDFYRPGRKFEEIDSVPGSSLIGIGSIWMHTKRQSIYIIQSYPYNTITDQFDVRYSDAINDGKGYRLNPNGREFTRQISGDEKAFFSNNEDGTPRYKLIDSFS